MADKDEVKIDEHAFMQRLNRLFQHHTQHPSMWNHADSFEITIGANKDDDDAEIEASKKSSTLFMWLLGYEFTDTVMFFSNEIVHLLTSTRKVQYLTEIKNNNPEKLKVYDKKNVSYSEFLDLVKPEKTVGVLENDILEVNGAFAKGWYDEFNKTNVTRVDVTAALAHLFVHYSEADVAHLKNAGQVASLALKRQFVKEMETTIDEDKKITHSKLADDTEDYIVNYKKKSNKDNSIEVAFGPIVQSGAGNYNLQPSGVTSDNNELHVGTIIAKIGVKYEGYCAMISRTYMVGASSEEEKTYNLLVEIYDNVKKQLKVGTKLSQIYKSARAVVETKKPGLLPHFLNHVGYGIGIAYYIPEYEINANNDTTITKNMGFCIHVGFKDVDDTNKANDAQRKQFSLLIADTYLVGDETTPLTTAKMSYDDNSYTLEDEDEDEDQKPSNNDLMDLTGDDVRLTRTREKQGSLQNAEDRRKKQQDEILVKKQNEFKRRSKDKNKGGDKESFSVDAKLAKGEIFSYKSVNDYPKDLKRNRIHIDPKRETVMLPINSTHVPFHIATIKNVSKADEGDYMILRINFKTAQQNFGQTYAPAKLFPSATFIKEISYRSKNPENLSKALREIQDLRKRITQREKDINEKGKEIQQGALEIRKGVKPVRLPEVYMRPGKKAVGVLECHENGLRFTPQGNPKGGPGRIDILFTNIKHAFFQAATSKDIIVLLHFHLHNPIMIGKKAHLDVQFYTEVVEEYDQLVGKFRRSTSDAESIEEEARERALKAKLNKNFQIFTSAVEEKAGDQFEFDAPYRDLEFSGTPFRSSVMLVPTVNCLVSLTEVPFFVLTLDDVEIAHFERIKFGLRNFDLVFVLKDYNKTVVSISSVPIEKLDLLKDWLNQVEIKYFEGTANLVWPKIMKTIREDTNNWDPWSAEYGWKSFLDLDDTAADDEDDPDDDPADEYREDVSDDDDDDDGEDSEEYNSEQDTDDESLDEEEEDSDDEDKGMSWDELDKEAERADKQARDKHGDYSDDEEGALKQPAKKKRKTGK
jgi:nucleosome binding factor SPN SPT16 subunit